MAKSLKEEFTKGIIKENPVLRLMLGRTGFLLANISARPKMMQLTTMSGRNTPSDLLSAGT